MICNEVGTCERALLGVYVTVLFFCKVATIIPIFMKHLHVHNVCSFCLNQSRNTQFLLQSDKKLVLVKDVLIRCC